MNLSDRALLVQLNISQWTARKYDKKVTKEVADSNNTTMAAGRYNKSLLPMNEYLDRVHKKAGYIRTKYYENTLPWGLEGTQMLPSANYLNFMTEFRSEKAQWETLVRDFLNEYSTLRMSAQSFLGSLYNDSDYPDRDTLANKFRMDMAVFPVPTSDFRVQLSADELSSIQRDMESRLRDASATAMKDVWTRLFERVQHMADKLADPTGIFRDSMVENAREICAMLPRLNFTDDANLEAMRQEVESKIAKYHPDALRQDPVLRRDTAAEAKAIMDKMSVFMSGL
jgi:hypothetical protein